MKIIKKTHILVETKRKIIVSQSPSDTPLACQQCGGQMMTAQTASTLLGINIREIYQLIEKGNFHFSDSNLEVTHICSSAISRTSPND